MQSFQITEKDAGRLDSFLLGQLPALHMGLLHRFLRENKIKVNGRKVPLGTRLCAGDEVRVYLPPALDDAQGAAADAPVFLRARRELSIAYEDDAVLIADKPAGIPVSDEKDGTPDTLLNRVLRNLYERGVWQPQSAFTPCLCHRLDTGTSGLVVLAKTPQAAEQCTALIRDRALDKRYVCVTAGIPRPAAATLEGYLQKDAAQGRVRVLSHTAPGAKEIVTRYRTLCTSGALALLEVQLVTGRTHQIRAHLASIGCPVLGDGKYGVNTVNRRYKTKYQLLCAYRLTFPVLREGPCAGLSGRCITAAEPWFYSQMLNGTLR